MYRSISLSDNSQSGIVKFLLTQNKNIPKLSTNAQNDNVYPEKMYTTNSPLQFDNDKYPVDLTFDFGRFSISITDYKLFLWKGWTPSAQWEVKGRNSIKDPWSSVDLPDVDTRICPEGEGNHQTSQCNEAATKTVTLNNSIGPYRFIQFSVLKSRLSYDSLIDNGFMRIEKLEFYGSIWYNSRFLSCKQHDVFFHINIFTFVYIMIK